MSCWNRIGVYGDLSCTELSTHGHCRDCPTYRTTAARLLDCPLSADQLTEATTHLAREKPAAISHAPAMVIFRVGAAWLALPGAVIQEVVTPRPIHSVPHRRNGTVLGLVNIRGELLVCMALWAMLNLEVVSEQGGAPSGRTAARMLVTQQPGSRIVYPVEEVFGVARFQPQDYAPAPPLIARAAVSFTKAVLSWGGNPVSLLDEQSLLAAANRSLALATAI